MLETIQRLETTLCVCVCGSVAKLVKGSALFILCVPGKNKDNNNEDRYVTTAPSYDAKLRPNDKVTSLSYIYKLLSFIVCYLNIFTRCYVVCSVIAIREQNIYLMVLL